MVAINTVPASPAELQALRHAGFLGHTAAIVKQRKNGDGVYQPFAQVLCPDLASAQKALVREGEGEIFIKQAGTWVKVV